MSDVILSIVATQSSMKGCKQVPHAQEKRLRSTGFRREEIAVFFCQGSEHWKCEHLSFISNLSTCMAFFVTHLPLNTFPRIRFFWRPSKHVADTWLSDNIPGEGRVRLNFAPELA